MGETRLGKGEEGVGESPRRYSWSVRFFTSEAWLEAIS